MFASCHSYVSLPKEPGMNMPVRDDDHENRGQCSPSIVMNASTSPCDLMKPISLTLSGKEEASYLPFRVYRPA